MARTRRGGYSNRTDKLAVQTPKGQAYGERQASEESQRAVPLPDANAQFQQTLAAAQAHDFQPVGLGQPSSRPDEPLTAGMPIGAGAGPESANLIYNAPTTDPDLMTLAGYVPTLELLAMQPGTTEATRNLIRRLRGGAPSDAVRRDPWA